jgi:hypothetical protein
MIPIALRPARRKRQKAARPWQVITFHVVLLGIGILGVVSDNAESRRDTTTFQSAYQDGDRAQAQVQLEPGGSPQVHLLDGAAAGWTVTPDVAQIATLPVGRTVTVFYPQGEGSSAAPPNHVYVEGWGPKGHPPPEWGWYLLVVGVGVSTFRFLIRPKPVVVRHLASVRA